LIVCWPDGKGAGTTNDELVSFIDFAPTMLSLADLSIPGYMQGQVFLGEDKATPRKYVYAFRDRMDPAPETIRAVRDERFKYVRNYRPDLPYLGFIPYRDQAVMMQKIQGAIQEDKLGPDQWQFWAKKKPLEELYDTRSDPHEIHNLASDPAYFEKLADLRKAHEDFVERYGDLGMIPETELVKRLWPPDGTQPRTAKPVINKKGKTVVISCDTEGASIAYRFAGEENWRLYSRPFAVKNNQKIESMAVRIGWKPSEAAELTL
jgi:arylsulfatase A-like enzyme